MTIQRCALLARTASMHFGKHKRNDANHTETLVYNIFIRKLAQNRALRNPVLLTSSYIKSA